MGEADEPGRRKGRREETGAANTAQSSLQAMGRRGKWWWFAFSVAPSNPASVIRGFHPTEPRDQGRNRIEKGNSCVIATTIARQKAESQSLATFPDPPRVPLPILSQS